MGWNRPQGYGCQTANVNANLHGGGAGKDVTGRKVEFVGV